MKSNPAIEKMIENARKEGRIVTEVASRAETPGSGFASPEPVAFVSLELLAEAVKAAKSEQQFSELFHALARKFAWKAMHIRNVLVKQGDHCHYETPYTGDGKGEFDWQLLRDCLLKVELKFGRNKPTPEQIDRLADYKQAGVEAYIWWPSDWDEIVARLSRPK